MFFVFALQIDGSSAAVVVVELVVNESNKYDSNRSFASGAATTSPPFESESLALINLKVLWKLVCGFSLQSVQQWPGGAAMAY